MARLPEPGADKGQWGEILNDYLQVEHNTDGTLKKAADIAAKYEKPAGGIPAGDLNTAAQISLTKADASVQSINAVFPTAGNVTLTASDVSAIAASAKGAANGVAAVDSSGDVVNAAGAPLATKVQMARSGLSRDMAFMGDSITFGGQGDTNGGVAPNQPTLADNKWGDGWPSYAEAFSLGRIRPIINAGIAGNTSAQMLTRITTDVISPLASLNVTRATVPILTGHNDGSTNYPADSDLVRAQRTVANVESMIVAVTQAGHIPVIMTMLPNNSNTERARCSMTNAGLRALADKYGLPLFDSWAVLADPSDGHYIANSYTDSTHPNQNGYRLLGQAFATTIAPQLTLGEAALAGHNLDSATLWNGANPNTLLSTETVTGVPDNWSLSGGTNYTRTLITDATLSPPSGSKVVRMVGTSGATGNSVMAMACGAAGAGGGGTSGGFAVGNRISFGVGYTFVPTGAGGNVIMRVAFTGASGSPLNLVDQRFSRAVAQGVLYRTATVPAGTTAITINLILNGEGEARFARPTLRNLTALGIS